MAWNLGLGSGPIATDSFDISHDGAKALSLLNNNMNR
jgi:hypothetical protein